jgi:adenosine deaminase
MAYFARVHPQNLRYVEIFFDPQAHTNRGVSFETVIRGIRRAQEKASAELGIESQLIMCFLRDMTAGSAASTLAESAPYKDWIIGVGLDSDERGNPPVKFAAVFAEARAMGYRLTMHCDVDQENSVEHIWQCLNDIGVERIDHGVNSLEDDRLVGALLEKGIPLTVCPISNSYVTDGTKAAEIKRMLELGLKVSVNSDDPAYFPGYVQENLGVVQQEAGLTRDDLIQLSRNAFDSAWLPEARRTRYLREVEAYAAG